jgi:hypothetical protein
VWLLCSHRRLLLTAACSSRRAPAVSTIVDLSLGIVVPLHAHMGVRSVLLDYVHEPSSQSLALAVLVRERRRRATAWFSAAPLCFIALAPFHPPRCHRAISPAPSRQAGVTVLTAVGLTKFNLTDVGLTEGVKSVFVAQPPPAKLLASSKLH